MERTKERDTTGQRAAKAAGWETRVVWECALKEDTSRLISELNEMRKNAGSRD
jgi:G:T-mismatch repair DNA endonuclease (very short patch repair protein)